MDEVVLMGRLRDALQRLNPEAPSEAIAGAVEQFTAERVQTTLVTANEQIYNMLKDGVRVSYKDEDGADEEITLRVIDWNTPDNNDWLAVQQLWVLNLDGLYKRRPDVVLFINGLPLVFIELKTFHRNVERAYRENLSDYKDTISHIFWYNAFIILSNGQYSRMGSVTSTWEYFHEWKKISDESEAGRIDLETMLYGTCEKSRLLDIIENFTLFKFEPGGKTKLVARNHQYLGVNNAIEAVQSLGENKGRLGVFWHTQGSGKSYSMVFFSQKVLRKLQGNWTFLVVTDRDELDDQIYQNFADVGAVPSVKRNQREIQADSGNELKRLLTEDHRYLFTLIQKFHTRPQPGEQEQPYPKLSDRENIIVMTDEAHRSQYDAFAANMRRALPEAAFIGFTGTPLMAGEERTKQVFGDYISVYDFKQSVEDGSTVPLYYENRIPRLELTNEQLNEDMAALLEDAMLDDVQEEQLENQFKQEYQVITRKNRQDTIAQDIVAHYMERGFSGRSYNSKAMVVCIDKLTAVRMYERVKTYWNTAIDGLKRQLKSASNLADRARIRDQIKFMNETDMTVVISQAQGEVDFFRQRGIDITPIRSRMVNEALDSKFKKPDNPLRLVFVCAMWMTGFDAPACSTIYLDKPMRNHTLMQTIARANRVFKDKQDGLIVDYIGIFRNLEQALSIYGTGSDADDETGDKPIETKQKHLDELAAKVDEAVAFCEELGIDLEAIYQTADRFDRDALKADAVETILIDETTTQQFLVLARDVNRLVKANRPHPETGRYETTRRMLLILSEALVDSVPDIDLTGITEGVDELLDESVMTEEYVIDSPPVAEKRRLDLSQIDFDALRQRFEAGHRRTATERLRGSINSRLRDMVRRNRTRMNYLETFQQMIDEYNAGSVSVDEQFQRLMAFYRELDDEQQRTVAEGLSEEELAVYDLLTKPEIDLSPDEVVQVKEAAKTLLDTLKRERLGLDWRKKQKAQAEVRSEIRVVLDQKLPNSYGSEIFDQKCDDIYQHVYESYFGAGRSIFDPAA